MEDHNEEVRKQWEKEQEELKKQLVVVNDFRWSLDGEPPLNYVAGVDISFVKGNDFDACACLVVLSWPDLEVVHSMFEMIQLKLPYIAGFLAFREVPFLLDLINKLRATRPDIIPQLILVDGNGYLHPRGFGLACHLGVLADIPTIGIGKTLIYVDGLEIKSVKKKIQN